MTRGTSPADDDSESSSLVTPRWLNPALLALAGATAIALMLTGRVVWGLVVLAGIAVVLVLAVVFRIRLRAFNRRAAATTSTYGTLAAVGVGWMILGVWQFALPGSDLLYGAACVVFGLLTVLAYAPKFFQLRSLARSR